MAFVNTYLTDEDKKMFAQRAIPTGLFWKGGFLGANPYSKLWCTLDRDAHIYLFNLGVYHDAEDHSEENFRLVWDSLAGDEAIHIIAKMTFTTLAEANDEMAILWHLVALSLPDKIKHEKEAVVSKFKEALTSFGLDGDPDRPVLRKVIFDF